VRPSDDEIAAAWPNGTFVFDANVLLNVHRFSESSSRDLQEVIKKLEGRVLIPDQVALEYLKNRADVIDEAAQDRLSSLKTPIDNLEKAIQQLNEHRIGARRADFLADLRGVKEKWLSNLRESGDRRLQDVAFVEDLLQRALPPEEPTAAERDDLVKQCKGRFDREFPPGLKDRKKEGSFYWGSLFVPEKYGDALVWLQIIKEFREERRSGPLIYVTDDQKEDWWHVRGGKKLGPRVELASEAAANGVDMLWFYTTEHFLSQAKEKLGATVSDETLAEAAEVDEVHNIMTVLSRLEKLKSDAVALQADYVPGEHPGYLPVIGMELGSFDELLSLTRSPSSRASLEELRKLLAYFDHLPPSAARLQEIVRMVDQVRSELTRNLL